MTYTRRIALGILSAAIATPVLAKEPEVFATNGVAIHGYDPVAYFTKGEPVEGSAEHSLEWKGFTWQFASAENLATFKEAPENFAPQYGGYCAYAVARGYTATTDPFAWSIYNDKLYLNYSKSVRLLWSANKSGNVEKGDANWPDVLG